MELLISLVTGRVDDNENYYIFYKLGNFNNPVMLLTEEQFLEFLKRATYQLSDVAWEEFGKYMIEQMGKKQ